MGKGKKKYVFAKTKKPLLGAISFFAKLGASLSVVRLEVVRKFVVRRGKGVVVRIIAA